MTRHPVAAALIGVLLAATIPAAADARRAATPTERADILAALHTTARCSHVVVSTVDDDLAAITPTGQRRGCGVAGNGFTLVSRKVTEGWTGAGSNSLDRTQACRNIADPDVGFTRRVAKDLRLCGQRR